MLKQALRAFVVRQGMVKAKKRAKDWPEAVLRLGVIFSPGKGNCSRKAAEDGIAPANPMVDVSGVCAGRLLCQFCGVGGRGEFGQ